LAACGSDSSTSPTSAIAGTYVLATIDGTALPATVINFSGADTTVVMADTIVLNSNLTYTRHSLDTLRITGFAATASQNNSSGTYTLADTVITLTKTGTTSSSVGKLVNGVGTVSDTAGGVTIVGVYHKQ
jgi:hypothetical protein